MANASELLVPIAGALRERVLADAPGVKRLAAILGYMSLIMFAAACCIVLICEIVLIWRFAEALLEYAPGFPHITAE